MFRDVNMEGSGSDHLQSALWFFAEKDVNRTDRTNRFYEGIDNPGLVLLHDILMTYCMYDFDLGEMCLKSVSCPRWIKPEMSHVTSHEELKTSAVHGAMRKLRPSSHEHKN